MFGEPAPESDTWKPWVLRNIWRYLTSMPVAPMVRERVKVGMEPEVVVTGAVVGAAVLPLKEARVSGPTVPVCEILCAA